MLRFFAVIALFYLRAFVVSGQQNSIDSLSKALEATHDRQKQADILNELSSTSYDSYPEKAYQYATRAHTLALDLNYPEGTRRALTFQGYYFYLKGEYTKALYLYRQSSNVPVDEKVLLGYNLAMIGNVFRALAQYDSANIYYTRSIDLLTGSNSPSTLAFSYKNLARLYVLQWKNKDAKDAFDKAMKIYEATGNRLGIADTWFSLSGVSQNEARFMEASQYVESACRIAKDLKDDFLNLQCLVSQGDIHFRLGNHAIALKSFFDALKSLERKDMPLMLVKVYSGIGNTYEVLGQNDVSLNYFMEALKVARRIGTKHEIGQIYSNLAWIYKNKHDFEHARNFIQRSLAIRKQIGDEHGIANCYNVSGVIYLEEEKYGDAESFLRKSLEIRKRIGYREGVSACLFNLALVFEEQKQYHEALQYQVQALAIDEHIGNKYAIGVSCNSMGSLYTNLKKFSQAQKFLKRAERLAAETGSKLLLLNNHYYWSEYYEAGKDTKTALAYYKKYSEVNDSIYQDISAYKLAELQALYQVEKKDQEIELLNREKLFQENEIRLQRASISFQRTVIISVITGLVLVSLLAFIILFYNRRIKKAYREITEQKEEIQAQSEELIEANQTIAEINKKLEGKIEERTVELSRAYKELDTFFYRSSHDFRRPLTTFLGLAEVAKITVKDPYALELFGKVKETASNLDKMLVKLQSISDVASRQLVYKEVVIENIFNTVCDTYRDELDRKKILISAEVRIRDRFISYPAMIGIIIGNLVENAIHFSGTEKPFIRLTAVQYGNYVTIEVLDNGQGIAKEYQEHVFGMYYRANERSKGNGLGLYIVKKAVEKLDGSISLSSMPQTGSTFTIMLPMGTEALG